jgi:hypothetical protein
MVSAISAIAMRPSFVRCAPAWTSAIQRANFSKSSRFDVRSKVLLEERDDRLRELLPAADDVLAQMLLVVVVALVDVDAAHSEEVFDLLEAMPATRSLGHDEPVEQLMAASIAPSLSPIGLLDEADGEATFSVDEADYPIRRDRPFLLIFRTDRIVTVHTLRVGLVPDGSSGFPAYSRMLSVTLLSHRATIYLRTVIVTAAVYRGLASVLRQAEAWLTPPRNLPAPGRRQPLYVVLRLSRGLCFW